MTDLSLHADHQLYLAGWQDNEISDKERAKNLIAFVVRDLVDAYEKQNWDKNPKHLHVITHLFTKVVKGENLGRQDVD